MGYKIDTLIYVAIAVLSASHTLPYLNPNASATIGVITVGLTAWKAKRSQGKPPPDMQSDRPTGNGT